MISNKAGDMVVLPIQPKEETLYMYGYNENFPVTEVNGGCPPTCGETTSGSQE